MSLVFDLFPLLMLNSDLNKGKNIISETSYFSTDVDLLRVYSCPTCKSSGCMFRGFFFIQCKECTNCFLDESELTQLMIKQHNNFSLSSG